MNPVCGDVLALTLRIEDGRIAEARVQTEGCTASVATSSILTEMVTGLTLEEAAALTHEDIADAVGGLPASKLHSASLVIAALRRAIESYREGAGLMRPPRRIDVKFLLGLVFGLIIGYGFMTYAATNQAHEHEPPPPSGA